MFHKKIYLGMVIGSTILSACSSKTQEGIWNETNPFYNESSLPYHVPDFNQIKSEHFLPALREGMRQQIEEINTITNSKTAVTFENTLVALEKSGQLLARTNQVFGLLTGAYTNEALQAIEAEIAPELALHHDAIYLNTALFERVKSIYNTRHQLKLDTESLRLVEVYFQRFELAGANLSTEDKQKLSQLNGEIASLTTKFSTQLLAGTKNASVSFTKDELVGLSENELNAFKQAYGTYQIDLLNTTQQPELQNLTNKAAREKLYNASITRNERNDENDTRKTILEIVHKRAQQAKLLGFSTYAEWNLQDQMAKTPAVARGILEKMVPTVTTMALKDGKTFSDLAKKEDPKNDFTAADWNYYAEKVRKQQYDLDENELKNYLNLDSVLIHGIFNMSKELYGITFKQRKDIPVWHEDVTVYELFNEDQSAIGLFFVDFFKRSSKQGGAWMSNLVEQSHLLNHKPVIYNVCNFNKPAKGQPALISFDDVITVFHEFGHALHGFFSNQQFASLAGTNVSRDFVEFPSQFHEHFATDKGLLKKYAKHWKTGEVIPDSLITKMKNAANFNKGYALTEMYAAALLDLSWHTIDANTKITDVTAFEAQALITNKTNLPLVPPRYKSTYFSHIFGGGYAAGYFAYVWAEMLDHDAYEWLIENGGMNRKNGQILRDKVFSKGNSEELNQVYLNFRGKEASIQPLLKFHGLID